MDVEQHIALVVMRSREYEYFLFWYVTVPSAKEYTFKNKLH
jgi:hypothetical protein